MCSQGHLERGLGQRTCQHRLYRFARLLPGINSLLLISQVYFLRLRLSEKAQTPEILQCHALLQKRCHREDVSGVNHIQGLCALMGRDRWPNAQYLAAAQLCRPRTQLCLLSQSWLTRETDPHWQTPHEPCVEATWLPCEGEGAGWKPDPDNHPGLSLPWRPSMRRMLGKHRSHRRGWSTQGGLPFTQMAWQTECSSSITKESGKTIQKPCTITQNPPSNPEDSLSSCSRP